MGITPMKFPAGLRALNHFDFRHFFVAQCVSQVGWWMQSVGQAWLVLQLTNSPLRLGLLGALQFGPFLLFSVMAGAIIDRLPQRRLLVMTQMAFATYALALAVLVWTGHVAYWQIALLATISGLTNTLDQPARQAFVLTLVGKADVMNAVALNSAAFNAARIVGPAAAGLLIGQFGVAPAFFLNGLAFLIVVATLVNLRESGAPPSRQSTTILSEIGEGLGYALRTPRVRLLLGLLAAVSLTVFNFNVYVPLLARTVFGLGPEGFGFLMTALGVGAVTGALTLGTRRGERASLVIVFTMAAVACGALVGLGVSRRLWGTVALLVVTGFSGIIAVTSCNIGLQLEAPVELRGRVMSLYTWVYYGPIGVFGVGAISERWGVLTALLVAGTVGLLCLAMLAWWWRRQIETLVQKPRRT